MFYLKTHYINTKELIQKTNPDFSDVRIISITKSKDTIEVPYFIEDNELVEEQQETRSFTILNTSSTAAGNYYTLELGSQETINQLNLIFANKNYDWKLKVEGSNDQRSWFTLVKDYRIVGINNPQVDFSYGTIEFPKANFNYYRIFIPTSEITPELTEAQTVLENLNQKKPLLKQINQVKYTLKKENKSTLIFIELPYLCPVNQISLNIQNKQDYYRPIQFFFQTDSTQAETGIIYNYSEPVQDILYSKNEPIFSFPTTLTKEIHISIDNEDNSPLTIEGISVFGITYSLVARFDESGEHFLLYGNNEIEQPHYDIVNFKEFIPEHLENLQLGEEKSLKITNPSNEISIFSNKIWLWSLMLLIIFIVGLVTYKMLISNKAK